VDAVAIQHIRTSTSYDRADAAYVVLSGKVGAGDTQALGDVMRPGRPAAQAMAGVPVTARQVVKRSALVSR
jgi:hypothetical protein